MSKTSGIDAALRESMVAWRHDLHAHPELGFEEHATAEKVATVLAEAGIEVHRGVGRTGVVGVLRRGRGGNAAIGLRADMDALAISEANTFEHRSRHAGRMHACGHDGHTTMLLGAAAHLARHGSFDGTVVFIFQPAEEHGCGAQAMIDDGLFERFPVRAVYGMHNFPGLPVGRMASRAGPIMACEDNFEIVIEGRGAHAALPHLGVDPIAIGAQVVMALQTVVSRTLDPVANAVVSVTEFIGDGTRNVLPGTVTLRGDTRSFLPEVQDHIETTMRRIVEGVCAAHGAGHRFRYTREFVSTINSAVEAGVAARVAREVAGEANVDADCAPIMASEDFGSMLRAVPGCYLLLGNGGGGPGGCGLHNPGYDFNDEILPLGAAFWVRLVESELAGAP